MRVAIVGGTGPFGRALAARLSQEGHEVVIGSRDAARAAEIAAELGVDGAANGDAVADAELVVLATKAEAVLDTARGLAADIGRTPVLSVASELRRSPSGLLPRDSEFSLAEELQGVLDGPVVAGLHSLAASNLAGADAPDEDALVCGDVEDAKRLALELAGGVTSGRALDAGPLAASRVLEGLTAVIVNLNRRYGGHAGLRVTGLD
jgi:8-hydroxy-5-deazaflavin:NADPH oxidoreductase